MEAIFKEFDLYRLDVILTDKISKVIRAIRGVQSGLDRGKRLAPSTRWSIHKKSSPSAYTAYPISA